MQVSGAAQCRIGGDIETTGATPAEATGTSFAAALSDAISHSRLPLERIQSKLSACGTPVSVATLSYWRSGRSMPRRQSSLRAVANLETIVGAESGSLRALLPACAAAGSRLTDRVPGARQAERALGRFGLPYAQPVQVHLMSVDRHLYADGREVARVECVGQVLGGQVDRLPSVMAIGRGRRHPAVRQTAGFVLGREYRDHGNGMLVGELLLPRAYTAGERVHLSTTLEWDTPAERGDETEWAVVVPCDEFRLSVHFEGRAPRMASHFTRCAPAASTPPVFGDRLDVVDGVVTLLIPDASPAIHGIRWSW